LIARLEAIDGIGPAIADKVVHFFKQPGNVNVIEKLKKAGVRMEEERSTRKGGIFAGKMFVLTGSLSRFPRDGAIALIESEEGRVSSSVSRKTDYVLVGANPGSKYRKALDLGVEIVDEDTFVAMMEKAKKRHFPEDDQLGMEI
jgi:DNA ligase (NAD+)